MGLPVIFICTGNSTGLSPSTMHLTLSSNLPQTLLYIVTVMGISELAGKSPSNGENTIAIPLLFWRKNALSFSSSFVWVNVFPVAEVNF